VKTKQIPRNTTNQIPLVFLEHVDGKIIRKRVFHTRDSSANYTNRVHKMVYKKKKKTNMNIKCLSYVMISFYSTAQIQMSPAGSKLTMIFIFQFIFLHYANALQFEHVDSPDSLQMFSKFVLRVLRLVFNAIRNNYINI